MSSWPHGRGAAAIAAAVGALALPAGASAGVHAAATAYPMGGAATSASQIAAGNLDGDGIADLVVGAGNPGVQTVSLLPGRAGGRFGAPSRVSLVDPSPQGVAVGDFDEDGLDDVVVTGGAAVTVLLNVGPGGFLSSRLALPGGAAALGVAVGDFDGDAHRDIAVLESGAVAVIRGIGDGSFVAPSAPVSTGGAGGSQIAAGNVDGNVRDDVVAVPGAAGGVATLLSGVGGTLAPGVAAATPGTATTVQTADVNADGRADALVGYATTAAVSVLLGQAAGGLAAPRNLAVPAAATAAPGDLDHDGRPDVVAAGRDGSLSVFPGAGDGTFGARVPVASRTPYATALARDLDGDGFADVLLGALGSGTVVAALDRPSAAPDAASLAFPATGIGATSPVQALSVTNDGRPPLHVASAALGGANPGDFVVVTDGCSGQTLAAGARCVMTLALRPAAAGTRAADLAIASDSAEGVAHVALGGTAPGSGVLAARADLSAPVVGVTVRAQRLRTVLRHGLRVTVSCTEPCTAATRLILGRALARRYHLARSTAPVVARRTVRLARAGRLPLRLHFTPRAARALRNASRITFTLRISAVDAAGNTRVRTTSVALLR